MPTYRGQNPWFHFHHISHHLATPHYLSCNLNSLPIEQVLTKLGERKDAGIHKSQKLIIVSWFRYVARAFIHTYITQLTQISLLPTHVPTHSHTCIVFFQFVLLTTDHLGWRTTVFQQDYNFSNSEACLPVSFKVRINHK